MCTYLPSYVPIHLFIEVQMLLYTLTKYFIGVLKNMFNAFRIILFYKIV
jgi:hypothetical protein